MAATHEETIVLLDNCDTTQNPSSCIEDRNNKEESLAKLGLFSIPRHEVTRIQHAIEIIVKFLLTSIHQFMLSRELGGSNKTIKRTLHLFKTKPTIHYEFNDRDLLKVGSFYENTKIHYPDEFDFIYVIAECDVKEYELMKDITAELSVIFHFCLQKTVLNPFPAGTCIKFVKYVGLHGPASKLEFSYKNSSVNGGTISIFVDISPATKVNIQSSLPNEINLYYPEWKSIVIATGSFLLLQAFHAGHPKHETKVKVSITESEHYYILEKMSEKHKQVYRVLKYILKNESIGEKLRELIRSKENRVTILCNCAVPPKVVFECPSYVIKTFMFHHCQDCNQCIETISGCSVSILNNILKLFETEQKSKRKPFSVSVKTITGETMEISDSFKSSLKITKYLKEVKNEIANGSISGIDRAVEQTSLTQEMVNDIQGHIEQQTRRRKCNIILTATTCAIMAALVIFCLGQIRSDTDSKTRLCWNGTNYIKGVSYTYSDYSNLSDLNLINMSAIPMSVHHQSTEVVQVRHIYCFVYDYEGETKSWANISRLHYCSNNNTCDGTKLRHSKIFNNTFDQNQICNTYDYERRFESKDSNSSALNINPTGKQITCWQTKAACLDMVERQYKFSRISSEHKKNCSSDQSCLPAFFKHAKQLSCYESKHFNESATTTDTEICCCNKTHCADPKLDEENELWIRVLVAAAGAAAAASTVQCLLNPILSMFRRSNA